MIRVAIIALVSLAYFISLFGWGRLIERFLRTQWPIPLTACLGLAGWIFLGGILNLVGIARAWTLDILALIGLAHSIWIILRSRHLKASLGQLLPASPLKSLLPSAVLIATVFIFIAATLVPPRAVNLHDDLEAYLNYPIRMLATGSLGGGGPLNALGSVTLGGQPFLHGFVLAHWPVGVANAVDALFAFMLCLTVVLTVALRLQLPFWLTPLIVAIPIFINPQYANVSALYTATALMLLLFLGMWFDVREGLEEPMPWHHSMSTGLIYAALVVLKSTFLIVIALHLLLLVLGAIYHTRRWKKAFAWAAATGASSLFFVSPWLLLYLPNWISAMHNPNRPDHSLLGVDYARSPLPTLDLFSTVALPYGFGATMRQYTFTAILAGLCGLVLLIIARQKSRDHNVQTPWAISACATLPIVYVIFLVVLAPLQAGPSHALRYICPVAVAAVPAALIIVGATPLDSSQRHRVRRRGPHPSSYILAFSSILLLWTFKGSLIGRAKQAFRYGSVLSFAEQATDPAYLTYNQFALSTDAREQVQKAQQYVPEGETLVAWTLLAIHLDFQRNRILDVQSAAMATPWMDFPLNEGTDAALSYLRQRGARYLLWHYRGYAVRSEHVLLRKAAKPFLLEHIAGVRTHLFVKALSAIVEQSEILHDDRRLIVARLPDPK